MTTADGWPVVQCAFFSRSPPLLFWVVLVAGPASPKAHGAEDDPLPDFTVSSGLFGRACATLATWVCQQVA
jgi:hypothetical protein